MDQRDKPLDQQSEEQPEEPTETVEDSGSPEEGEFQEEDQEGQEAEEGEEKAGDEDEEDPIFELSYEELERDFGISKPKESEPQPKAPEPQQPVPPKAGVTSQPIDRDTAERQEVVEQAREYVHRKYGAKLNLNDREQHDDYIWYLTKATTEKQLRRQKKESFNQEFADFTVKPYYKQLDAYAYKVLDNMPRKEARAIEQAFADGNHRVVRQFLERCEKQFLKRANKKGVQNPPQSPGIKSNTGTRNMPSGAKRRPAPGDMKAWAKYLMDTGRVFTKE